MTLLPSKTQHRTCRRTIYSDRNVHTGRVPPIDAAKLPRAQTAPGTERTRSRRKFATAGSTCPTRAPPPSGEAQQPRVLAPRPIRFVRVVCTAYLYTTCKPGGSHPPPAHSPSSLPRSKNESIDRTSSAASHCFSPSSYSIKKGLLLNRSYCVIVPVYG